MNLKHWKNNLNAENSDDYQVITKKSVANSAKKGKKTGHTHSETSKRIENKTNTNQVNEIGAERQKLAKEKKEFKKQKEKFEAEKLSLEKQKRNLDKQKLEFERVKEVDLKKINVERQKIEKERKAFNRQNDK